MENIPQASHAEMEIMKIIWQSGNKTTVGTILNELETLDKAWKSSTVATFLMRLVEKGFLTPEKKGRHHTYTATITEAEFRERQTQSFITEFYAGNAKELVASLMKQERLTQKDVEELTEFWLKGGDSDE
jgi:BlaI family penicillinase repressor